MEGSRLPDKGVCSEAWEDDDDNDATNDACCDGNDDAYGNVLVQPVVVAVLPIGSTGASKGSQDDVVTVCGCEGGVGDEVALGIAILDVFEPEEDGDGEDCRQFDAQASGGPVGNGLLSASWECKLASASVDGLSNVQSEEVQTGVAFQTAPLLAATCLVINCESLSKIIVEYWYEVEWSGWKRFNG